MMVVTLKDLRLKGACEPQVLLFKAIFGESVDITEAIILEHGSKFDLDWLAVKLLSAPLYADYKTKRAPLDVDYKTKRDSLDADYKTKRALAFWDVVKNK